MNTDLISEYKTAHLPLAAYLAIKGGQITKVEAQGGRGIFTFAFVNRTWVTEFNNGQAVIEPGNYAIKMSQLTQTAKRVIQDGVR